MSVEQVGPGGVSNSYGVRTTTSKVVYENDNTYQDVFIPTGSVPVTATPSGPGVKIYSPITTLLDKYGFVGDGVADDSAALQAVIDEARTLTNGEVRLPNYIRAIKLNSGITLKCDTDRLCADAPVFIDASGITSGSVITIDGAMANGNEVPFYGILNGLSDLRIKGAGSQSVAGAAGVKAITVRGTNGKVYFYQIKNVSIDGFETGIDLRGENFGVAFEDMTVHSALDGTCVQSLTGDGTNYGERWNFTRCMFFNSKRVLYNTTTSSDWFFLNCSFDYSDVMIETTAGRISLESCHIETNKDTDYLFKVGGNEATALSIAKSNIVLNNINKTTYELFDLADTVILGGIAVRDCLVAHNGGYGLSTYVRGVGRAVCQNLYGFTAQTKPAFSRSMNYLRDGFATGTDLAQWTLAGATLPNLGTIGSNDAVSLKFGQDAGITSATISVPVSAGNQLRVAYKYYKDNSTTGQAKLQVIVKWFDNKGTQIGGSITTKDQDGNTAPTWVPQSAGPSVVAPPGTVSATVTFQKSADTGAVGRVFLDEIVIHPIPN